MPDPNDSSSSDGATNVPASTPEADEDASLASEEIQRQAIAAIPHVEQQKVDPNAEYEPGVVLVLVSKGTTVEQLSQAMAAAEIESVEHNDVEVVTDDLMMVKLAPDATIDDAIYELESTGIAQSAQPNYVYEIAEEQAPASDRPYPQF